MMDYPFHSEASESKRGIKHKEGKLADTKPYMSYFSAAYAAVSGFTKTEEESESEKLGTRHLKYSS